MSTLSGGILVVFFCGNDVDLEREELRGRKGIQINYNNGQKSYILLHFWGVFQFKQVQPLPSPHKHCWTRVSRIFSEFQLCIGWGDGELQENFEKDALF